MTARYHFMSDEEKEAYLDGLPEQIRHVADHLEGQSVFLREMVKKIREARFKEPPGKKPSA